MALDPNRWTLKTQGARRETFERAEEERSALGDEYLSIEHLLLALTDAGGVSREDVLAAPRAPADVQLSDAT